jgi:hypothetical protein
MVGRTLFSMLFVLTTLLVSLDLTAASAKAQTPGQPTDWNRYFYYPYVYYPQNFQPSNVQYDHMYYRYPANRRIPVYNKAWYNFYPSAKPYHKGHHFILDVF